MRTAGGGSPIPRGVPAGSVPSPRLLTSCARSRGHGRCGPGVASHPAYSLRYRGEVVCTQTNVRSLRTGRGHVRRARSSSDIAILTDTSEYTNDDDTPPTARCHVCPLGPPLRTWGVLSTTAGDALVAQRLLGLLADHLDGVVEVPSLPRLNPVGRGSLLGRTMLEELVDGMSSVPQDVERIAYVDGEVLGMLGIEPVLQMISWLDEDHAAVVRAAPVTDALKLADGSRLVGSMDRRGLYVPHPPHVVRRQALAAALDLENGQRRIDDLAGLLVRTGHAVRVVWDGAAPVTLLPGT